MSVEEKLSQLAKLAEETAASNKLSANTAERAKELSQACYVRPDELTAALVGPQLDKNNPQPTVSGLYLLDAVSRMASNIAKQGGPTPPAGSPAQLARTWIQRLETVVAKVVGTTLQHIPAAQHDKVKKVLEIWEKADMFSPPTSAAIDRAVKDSESNQGRSTTPSLPPPASSVPPAAAAAPAAAPASGSALPASVAALLAQTSGKTPPGTPPAASSASYARPAPAAPPALTSQNTASVLANLSALIKPGAAAPAPAVPVSAPAPGLDTSKIAMLTSLVQGGNTAAATPAPNPGDMTLGGFDRNKFDPADVACLSQLAYRWQMSYGRPATMVDMLWLVGQILSANDPAFASLFLPAATNFAPGDPNLATRALRLPPVPGPDGPPRSGGGWAPPPVSVAPPRRPGWAQAPPSAGAGYGPPAQGYGTPPPAHGYGGYPSYGGFSEPPRQWG